MSKQIMYDAKACAYRAVGERDGTGKLDEVTSRDGVVLLHERDQVVDAVCDTEVGEEGRLDGREDEHRTVRSSTTAHRLPSAQDL